MTETLERIVREPAADSRETSDRVAAYLRQRPREGADEAIALFEHAGGHDDAHHAAEYLSVLPGLVEEKTRLVHLALDERPELRRAATHLVKWLPDDAVERVVARCVEDLEAEGAYDLLFECALFFPHHVRRHRDRIDDDDVSEASLPGAEDPIVDELVAAYRAEQDPDVLRRLSRIRTDRALSALLDLRPLVPDDEAPTLDAYIETSGVFPDSREASSFSPAFRGVVVARDDASHQLGSGFSERVPKCPICETPATRVLTLRAPELPYDLRAEPSFFWFTCTCDALDYLFVAVTPGGLEGMMVEMTDAAPRDGIVPDAPSLLLVEHSTQSGFGLELSPGMSNHQVGGYTPWAELDRNPRCPRCRRGMPFLASIDSGLTRFGNMRFVGTLFGFWCDEDAVACTMRQEEPAFT